LKELLKEYDIKPRICMTNRPQSDGLSERNIESALEKYWVSGEEICQDL
jgi:hypothetical protein